jgi:hypothetical protein
VVAGLPDAEFGITSLLDAASPEPLPKAMEATVAGLDGAALLAAASALGAVLTSLQERVLGAEEDKDTPRALGAFVAADLRTLTAQGGDS